METEILMEQRVQSIPHKGKVIIYMNFTDLEREEKIREVTSKAVNLITSQPEKSVLALSNVTNLRFDSRIVSLFKEFTKFNTPYIHKSVIFGINGLQKIVLQAIAKFTGRNIKVCKGYDTAMNYLTE